MKNFFSKSQCRITDECRPCRARKFPLVNKCIKCGVRGRTKLCAACSLCDKFGNCSFCGARASYCLEGICHNEGPELAKCVWCDEFFCNECIFDEFLLDNRLRCESHAGGCKDINLLRPRLGGPDTNTPEMAPGWWNSLLEHPLFPHGNKIFMRLLQPFKNTRPPEEIAIVYIIDTYVGICLERDIPFEMTITGRHRRGEHKLNNENYSYEGLAALAASNNRIWFEANIQHKDVAYLANYGLGYNYQYGCWGPSYKCMYAAININNFKVDISFECNVEIERIIPALEVFNPHDIVAEYAALFLDELKLTLGDKFLRVSKPAPGTIRGVINEVDVTIRGDDVGLIEHLGLMPSCWSQNNLHTTFYCGANIETSLEVLIRLV